MHVRKFEAETLNEALDQVKRELGPDAIILKTINHKGLKGAFKKSRVEVTAAISETSYLNKSRVDKVLKQDQKVQDEFYKKPASEIQNQINNYNTNSGYGQMGLNKVVKTVSQVSEKVKDSLDDFLSPIEESTESQTTSNLNLDSFLSSAKDDSFVNSEQSVDSDQMSDEIQNVRSENFLLKNDLQEQKNHISRLEKQMHLLQDAINQVGEQKDPKNIELDELKDVLKTLDLADIHIQNLVKACKAALTQTQLANSESVFEFALKHLHDQINTKQAHFSRETQETKAYVTVILSEHSSGQRTTANKLAVLQSDAAVLRYRGQKGIDSNQNKNLATSMYDVEDKVFSELAPLLNEVRNKISLGVNVVVDLKFQSQAIDESVRIIEALGRSHNDIEFMLCLSSIHSEIYNRKILSKYKKFLDGIIITYVDQCLSFGSLLNVHFANIDVPLKFFSTGNLVPDDLEAASAERILTSMFKL